MRDLLTIREYGLEKIGSWVLSTRYTSTQHLKHLPGIDFLLPHFHDDNNLVYAFAIGDDVIYVGETTKGITERFKSYRSGNPNVRDTDNRVKEKITEALQAGIEVTIWVSQPKAIIELPNGKHEIPASKPVEEMLISCIKPTLNKKDIGQSIKQGNSDRDNKVVIETSINIDGDIKTLLGEKYITDDLQKEIYMRRATQFRAWANYIAALLLTKSGKQFFNASDVKNVLRELLKDRYDKPGYKESSLCTADMEEHSNYNMNIPFLRRDPRNRGYYEFIGFPVERAQ